MTATILENHALGEAGHTIAYIMDSDKMTISMNDFPEMNELAEEAGLLCSDIVFYTEACRAPFVLFHEIVVATEHRRKGLGKSM